MDRWPARRLAVLLAAYTLFGAGYIAYISFIVAFLKSEGASGGEVGLFWSCYALAPRVCFLRRKERLEQPA